LNDGRPKHKICILAGAGKRFYPSGVTAIYSVAESIPQPVQRRNTPPLSYRRSGRQVATIFYIKKRLGKVSKHENVAHYDISSRTRSKT